MDSQVIVKPMDPQELPELKKLARRAFPSLQQLFVSWTEHVFVAEHAGRPAGAIILKFYPLPDGGKGGSIAWVFTDPEMRGLGVGQSLVDQALNFFEDQGCQEITTCVDGFNASSSKLFSNRGFEILSMTQQIRRYGIRFLAIWFRIFHYMDIGHFLWVKPVTPLRKPRMPWWSALLANYVVILLAMLRAQRVSPELLLYTPVTYLALLGLRHLGMLAVARSKRVDVEFRAWETGYVLSTIIAVALGGVFPIPGSLYPRNHDWSMKQMKGTFGQIALGGVLPVLMVATLATISVHFLPDAQTLTFFIRYLRNAFASFGLFDIVMVFFPFQVFNGRRIWDANRVLWVILAIWAVVLLFV